MPRYLLIALLLALLALPLARAEDQQVELMFVQTADAVRVEGNTLRLVNAAQQTLYFSDRPERLAGHVKMDAFLQEWTAKAGADNFGGNPPNAVLSVYRAGQPDNVLAVVELTKPVVDGKDLIYTYKVIEGEAPKAGGPVALFIDWIGVGGGVGFGYHGIGVGRRGPGFYR